MTFALRRSLMALCLIVALVLPKVSGLLLHLHPGVIASVICTGSEMVIVFIGKDGAPVEVVDGQQGPCIMADPGALEQERLVEWQAAPRSYRYGFSDTARVIPRMELGLLPDLRGPPQVG